MNLILGEGEGLLAIKPYLIIIASVLTMPTSFS